MRDPLHQHLLFVDDEAAFREAIAERLVEHGFRVEQAGTGEEALAKLNDFAFDGTRIFTSRPMPSWGSPVIVPGQPANSFGYPTGAPW